jgi:WD40 repeat protein
MQGRFDSLEIESRREIDSGGNEPRVSPDGRWLAWGNWQARDVAITRLGSNDPAVVLPIAGSATVAFSPDGRLARCRRRGGAPFLRGRHAAPRAFDPPAPEPALRPEFAFTHGSSLCVIALPPDELLIVDTKTGAELALLPARSCILWAVSFSPDDRFLAATSSDHRVLIWDFVKLRQELRKLGLDW